MEQNVCKECNRDFDTQEIVFRHLRAHHMTAKDYVLKWQYGNCIPKCGCGCGKETNWNVSMKRFTDFVHGHHAAGRIKSEDEKRRIGEKNRKNMREYLKKNPEAGLKKIKLMNAVNQTEDVRRKRKDSVNKTYTSMTEEEKQKFSDHFRKLWEDGTLVEAREKAAETYKQRYADGLYDFTERNDKISATITQRYLDGGFEWSTGQYTSVKTGVTCNYRSSWEKMYMEELDRREDVEMWKYEPMVLSYSLDGKTKRYIPDFQVILNDGTCMLVEVKPSSLIGTEMNEAKYVVARDFCVKNGWKYMTWSPEGVAQHEV